jgi:hypothetical protein
VSQARLDLAADPDVAQALRGAVDAGVPATVIDADLLEFAEGPQNQLTALLLAGRLWSRVRELRLAG